MILQAKEHEKLSYFIAARATMEMRITGKVEVVCPECGKHPVVDITEHRLEVRCPCGYVRDGEIYD